MCVVATSDSVVNPQVSDVYESLWTLAWLYLNQCMLSASDIRGWVDTVGRLWGTCVMCNISEVPHVHGFLELQVKMVSGVALCVIRLREQLSSYTPRECLSHLGGQCAILGYWDSDGSTWIALHWHGQINVKLIACLDPVNLLQDQNFLL